MSDSRRNAALAALAALASIACGGGESAPAAPPVVEVSSTPSPSPSPDPVPPPDPVPAPPVAPEAAPSAPVLDAAARTRLSAAVRAGRLATHEGRHADALTAFREALAIDGSSRRLRCEAGFVAHLAGDHDEAETLVDGALVGMPDVSEVPAELRVPYAMCLYNAGLVYQATNDTEDARRAWTDSLALRPNETVRARLEALPPPEADEHGAVLHLTVSMTAEEVTHAVVRHLARTESIENGDDPDEAEEDAEGSGEVRPVEAGPSGAGGIEASLIEVDSSTMFHDVVLVVRTADHIAAFRVLQICNPGQLSMYAEGSVISASITDVIPGGSPEIAIRTELSSSDDDLGGCVSYGARSIDEILCTVDGAIACAMIPRQWTATESCDSSCIGDWGERCGRDRPRAGTRQTGSYSVGITWAEGRASVDVENHDGDLPDGLAGSHDLADLLRVSPLHAL